MKKILCAAFCLAVMLNAEPSEFTVRDFVGINTNVGAYDHGYIEDLAAVAGWIREYHRWEFYEQNDDTYGWDSSTKAFNNGTWPFHNKFVDQCKQNGLDILICAEDAAPWASSNGKTDCPPYNFGDGTSEEDYIDKAEFIGQMVARYGSSKIDSEKLETADKKSGLGQIQYFEDHNEPDKWWVSPQWQANEYAKYLNAVHDSYNLEPWDDYPLFGIKSVDSNAMHVLGGIVGANTDWLNGILANTDGRIPFDVMNFHIYCTSHSNTLGGFCPEHEQYGLESETLKLQEWVRENAPGMPIWCTEFGWDTFEDESGKHSYVYAPEEAQANYLLRSLFLFMGYGIEKAFVFFDKDPNTGHTLQYSSSGIMEDPNHGLRKKVSFYYLATLMELLSDFQFVGIEKYRDGDPEVYSYLFQHAGDPTQLCSVIWCRKANEKYDAGTTVAPYRYERSGIHSAGAVVPVDQSDVGEEIDVQLENAGENNSVVVLPQIGETPTFLFFQADELSEVKESHHSVPQQFQLAAFPNPFNSELSVSFHLDQPAMLHMNLYNVQGQKVFERDLGTKNSGDYKETFYFSQLATGVYFLEMSTPAFSQCLKLAYMR